MPTRPRPVVRVALDWEPNANHGGLFLARARGWFANAGVSVKLLAPSALLGASPAAALAAGAVDVAVAPAESAISYATRGGDTPRLVVRGLQGWGGFGVRWIGARPLELPAIRLPTLRLWVGRPGTATPPPTQPPPCHPLTFTRPLPPSCSGTPPPSRPSPAGA